MADNIIKIAQDVALSTEGVSGIVFPGVLPIRKDKKINLDIHITVEYGVNIPEISWNVQENIKKKCDELNIKDINRINIYVEDIIFKEKKWQ